MGIPESFKGIKLVFAELGQSLLEGALSVSIPMLLLIGFVLVLSLALERHREAGTDTLDS